MDGPDPVFVSTLRADAAAFGARHPAIGRDAAGARILRSVLMKPESEDYVTKLHGRLEELAQGCVPGQPARPVARPAGGGRAVAHGSGQALALSTRVLCRAARRFTILGIEALRNHGRGLGQDL
jgi:hypothetical protein